MIKKFKYIGEYKTILSYGRVYDVLDYKNNNRSILLRNNQGELQWIQTMTLISTKPVFEDVTHEYRAEIIEEILK